MKDALIPIVAFAPGRWIDLPTPSQQVLVQLAKTRSVFVLEAPECIDEGGREFWELRCGARDLLVCRPRVASFEAFANPDTRARMAQALLRWLDIEAFVAWLYAPPVLTCVGALRPSLVIHDRSFEPRDRPRMRRRAIPTAAALASAGASGTV